MPSLHTISPDAIRVFPDDLRTLTSDILCRLDLPHADARRIADCLVAVTFEVWSATAPASSDAMYKNSKPGRSIPAPRSASSRKRP